MPKITPTQYASALFDAIAETAPEGHDKVLDNFVKILARNGDLGKGDEIQAEFRKLKLSAEGIKEVGVTVAKEMEVNHQIITELNKTVSDKLKIEKKIDESIIGGVVVRVDDTLIDASIKTQLNNLNKELKE